MNLRCDKCEYRFDCDKEVCMFEVTTRIKDKGKSKKKKKMKKENEGNR